MREIYQKFYLFTSRNVAMRRFGLNAYRAARSIRLGLFALSLLRMLFACAHRHVCTVKMLALCRER